MKKLASLLLISAVSALTANTAMAADIIEAPVMHEQPAPVVYEDVGGGWYIRGDIDYHRAELRDTIYAVSGGTSRFDTTELDDSWSLGGGIGYNVSKNLRVDLTADYWLKSDFRGSTVGTCGFPAVPCTSSDSSTMSALVVLANAYVDLGTYSGITPYVGAGIGVAHVNWSDLANDDGVAVTVHPGAKSMRGAAALMLGASYCLTDKMELDAGYRYTRIGGGDMFGYANFAGPGQDKGFDVHEVRAGVRYSFGGKGASHRCSGPAPQVVDYQPEPAVYK
ncbi:MAG: outer membrane protein [Rhizobiaceae bacterium]